MFDIIFCVLNPKYLNYTTPMQSKIGMQRSLVVCEMLFVLFEFLNSVFVFLGISQDKCGGDTEHAWFGEEGGCAVLANEHQ